MESQFDTLLQVIDHIRAEAPKSLRKIYRPSKAKPELVDSARTRAYIHLYLLVQHGILNFEEREKYITDGQHDGGLDAYYIDHEKKIRYLIQSKFHLTGKKFEVDKMPIGELVKMEIDRILNGDSETSYGKPYNEGVRRFQNELKKAKGIYHTKVILLANVPHSDYQIRKSIGYEKYEIFDFTRSYSELVFPYCTSTFYSPAEIDMEISLKNKTQVTLEGYIKTRYGESQVLIILAPTKEIGRIMSTYKNAILKYNPRNFITLQKSKVNREIEESITSFETNDFAILNNGVTMLAEDFRYEPHTGDKKRGRLIVTKPQIINGGQTAFTLSKIYDSLYVDRPHIFDGKEVLLRIVKLKKSPNNPSEFIEILSNATNRQNKIKEADRRSNHQSLVDIQLRIFDRFGYFLERKTGEFQEAKEQKVLKANYIVDRFEFVQAYTAFLGNPSTARSSAEKLFTDKRISELFPNVGVAAHAFFAYKVYQRVLALAKQERKNNYGEAKYGAGLRYGKFAIVAAVGATEKWQLSGSEDFDGLANDRVDKVLAKWKSFEARQKIGNAGFDNFYKGGEVDAEIKAFFG
ncbi:MAG: hypothetical protein EYC68_08110 [Chloroflexota bacterium]|nr:MAG: hypothetical protein EYC68_08110 [Chloroflexota bacterium]